MAAVISLTKTSYTVSVFHWSLSKPLPPRCLLFTCPSNFRLAIALLVAMIWWHSFTTASFSCP